MNTLSKRIASLSPEQRSVLLDRARAHKERNDANLERKHLNKYPLSYPQERIWLDQQWHPDNPFYNEAIVLDINGLLHIDLFKQSIETIIERHEILRTRFCREDDQVIQSLDSSDKAPITVIDLQDHSETQQKSDIEAAINKESGRVFKLDEVPLFQITLLKLDTDKYILIFVIHHIIFDGQSGKILSNELFKIYSSYLDNLSLPLKPLPQSYLDYVVNTRKTDQQTFYTKQLNFWLEHLESANTTIELPNDWPRSKIKSTQGNLCVLKIDESLLLQLKQLAKYHDATLFMVMLTVFNILLYRYTDQDDIIVGTPVSGRISNDFEHLIGVFINSLAIRTDLSGHPSFVELLTRVRSTTLLAFEHQDLPFEHLISALELDRDISRTPLFQVMFGFENKLDIPKTIAGLRIKASKPHTGTCKTDLSLSISENEQGLQANFEYNSQLFSRRRIERMMGHYLMLLNGVIKRPAQCIDELPLLTAHEHRQIVGKWNNTRNNLVIDKPIHQFFEQHAERNPHSIAVSFSSICSEYPIKFETNYLTYKELNTRANQLAHYILSQSHNSNGLVGICLKRAIDWIVVILAVLKTGKAYLPLDPDYPVDRLECILKDARPSILISNLSSVTSHFNGIVIDPYADIKHIDQYSKDNLPCITSSNSMAYVIYTSGSTGKPKGVMVAHRGLCNIISTHADTYNVDIHSKFLQFASFSFDGSVYEIFIALCSGAGLFMGTREALQPGQNLVAFMSQNRITHAVIPPAVLSLLPDTSLPDLQVLYSTGDVCHANLVDRWTKSCRFVNGYGPTEATIGSAMYDCKPGETTPPIGYPFANVQIHILDSRLQLVPVGVVGEMYIGGDGVAMGYINNTELTEQRFIRNPLSDQIDARMYKTGDLAFYREDGAIQFVGRSDRQIKIRGFRIEPGEIETRLNAFSGIKESVTHIQITQSGNHRIVAFVVWEHQSRSVDSHQLRSYLKKSLPDFMIPAAFVYMDRLPLSKSGKVDLHALPFPENESNDDYIQATNKIESVVSNIWSYCLNISNPGIDDDFFESGGNSLLITQLLIEIKNVFRIELPLRTFIEDPTIKGIAETLVLHELQPGMVERLAELYDKITLMSDEEVQSALAKST